MTGRLGESVAAGFLAARGYRIVARNVRFRFGEIDLICMAPGPAEMPVPGAPAFPGIAAPAARHLWVFAEVRTVRSPRFGRPEERFSPRKLTRLHRLAQAYLMNAGRPADPFRIDGVAVYWPRSQHLPRVTHWPGLPSPGR